MLIDLYKDIKNKLYISRIQMYICLHHVYVCYININIHIFHYVSWSL